MIKNIEDVKLRNKKNVLNTMKHLINLNLNLLNRSNLEKYRNKFSIKYPYILSVIDNRINIFSDILSKIDNNTIMNNND